VTTLPTVTEAPEATLAAPPQRPAADVFMRRLLRVDESQPRLGEDELRKGFSTSILVSAVRCVITYLVIPFLAPILGLAAGVAPIVGIPIGVLAIVFNIKSMRRFWRADHRFRWGYTAVSGTVIAMLVVLIALDVADIVS
jgi:multisubunit Na+/H+ antiporter MnhB subunit